MEVAQNRWVLLKPVPEGKRSPFTYPDVVLPILPTTAPRLQNETQLTAFEISPHVRKQQNAVMSPLVAPVASVFPAKVVAVEALPPASDLSVAALLQRQVSFQELLDRIRRERDAQAYFVSYAPPVLISHLVRPVSTFFKNNTEFEAVVFSSTVNEAERR